MRIFWSDSKLSKWLQNKVGFECKGLYTFGTDDYKNEQLRNKKNHPIVFWFTEVFLDSVQYFIYFIPEKINSGLIYISNRFFDKTHYVKTYMKPGEYYDNHERIFHGLMNIIVDVVECDKAWMWFITHDECEIKIPWYKHVRPFHHFFEFRYPELGIKYLEWEKALKETYQSKDAKKILDLYYWYKEVYPNRVDPYEDFYDEMLEKYPDDCHKIVDEKVQEHLKEDKKMMKRVIDLSTKLWT